MSSGLKIVMSKNRIKDLRQELKLSQSEFARIIGVSQSTIKDLELGNMKLSDNIANKINQLYGINTKWLSGKSTIKFDTSMQVFKDRFKLSDCQVYKTIEIFQDPEKKKAFFTLISK